MCVLVTVYKCGTQYSCVHSTALQYIPSSYPPDNHNVDVSKRGGGHSCEQILCCCVSWFTYSHVECICGVGPVEWLTQVAVTHQS